MLWKESGYKLIIPQKEGEIEKREEESKAKKTGHEKNQAAYESNVENIQILDTYSRDMKIAKKSVEPVTHRNHQKKKKSKSGYYQ